MNVHEYQAKQILARYNVRIPRGEVAYTKEEAREAAERIGGNTVPELGSVTGHTKLATFVVNHIRLARGR